MGERCTCDDIGDSDCPKHKRENELQDLWLAEKNKNEKLEKDKESLHQEINTLMKGYIEKDKEIEALKRRVEELEKSLSASRELRSTLRKRIEELEKQKNKQWQKGVQEMQKYHVAKALKAIEELRKGGE